MRIAFYRVAGIVLFAIAPLLYAAPAKAQDEAAGAGGAQEERLVQVDAAAREVRVACEALRVEIPLEFICVVTGTADHESLLRTRAKPSAVHAALLALGLEPGRPLRFSEAADRWLPPAGPPLRIEVEWTDADGQHHRERVGRLLRSWETGQPMPPRTFVFVGSQIYHGEAGDMYAADATGQVVSLVNFEYPTIDVGELKSNANETLEWEINPDIAPPQGTPVTMILRPIAVDPTTQPSTQPAAPVDVVLVGIDADGTLRVEHAPVDLDDLAMRIRTIAEADTPTIRVSAARGAPVGMVGRVFGRLVEAGYENVTFTLPRRATTQPAPGQPVRLRVSDAGRQIAMNDDEPMPLGDFVRQVSAEAGLLDPSRPIRIESASFDVRPVHLAAPAAALYVLGYGPITVESAEATSSSTRIEALRAEWERRVLPQSDALRSAAQTHYEVMQAYQDEINRLLDEADRLRREMDALQQRFNEMTTPQPSLDEDDSKEKGSNDENSNG